MDQHARLESAQLRSAAQPLLDAFPGDIWLAHEIVELPSGKLDKPPVSGFRSNDSTSWCSLESAIAIAERYPPGAAGVSFAIVETTVTFDFDDCVEPNDSVIPEVEILVDRLDSFSYRTVSGTGLRVVCRNDPDDPIPPGKYTGFTDADTKVEVFVGPCNFYNTFSPWTNGKPVATRSKVVRALLAELTDAARSSAGESGSNLGKIGRTSDLGKRAIKVKALLSALKAIPHDTAIDRELWVKLGGAVYAGTDGSDQGRTAFIAWSETWPRHKEDPDQHHAAAEKLWDSFIASPPRALGAGTVFQLAQQHGWTWPKKPVAVGGFVFTPFVDVKVESPQDFVEDFLETDSVAMVFGPPGAGKTFFVLDLLLHVAWGLLAWFGKEIEQGPALLFALEGRRGVARRIAAFRQHHRLQGEDLPFWFTSDPVDLSDGRSVDAVIKAIKAQACRFGRPIKIVGIDTLSAALGNGDENTSETTITAASRSAPAS
jgi:hypothetical protein